MNLKCQGSPLLHVLFALAALPRNVPFVTEALPLVLPTALDASANDDSRRGCLHIAAQTGCAHAAAAVVEAKRDQIDFLQRDRKGWTALHAAAHARQLGMMQWLLQAAPDAPALVAAFDDKAATAAHVAARIGFREGLDLLLEADTTNGGGLLSGMRDSLGATPADAFVPYRLPAAGGAAEGQKTLLMTHIAFADHHTCVPATRQNYATAVPPENTGRLDTLLSPANGTLRTAELTEACDVRYEPAPALISDVLRVHEYTYVRRLLSATASTAEVSMFADAAAAPGAVKQGAPMPDWVKERVTGSTEAATAPVASSGFGSAAPAPDFVSVLDGDTALSRGSWDAALRAAGAVCAAIDCVVAGTHKNAFCAVRPPGHHAGPTGIVTCANDKDGSHGFCLLNNVAIGAAYARATYGRASGAYGKQLTTGMAPAAAASAGAPIRKIAIFDFDVHHGNGTEAIIRNLYPSEVVETIRLPFARGAFSTIHYSPWLDHTDGEDTLFISSHGFGKRSQDQEGEAPWFYPASGASEGWDQRALDSFTEAAQTDSAAAAGAVGAAASSVSVPARAPAGALDPHGEPSALSFETREAGGGLPVPEPLFERGVCQPHIINVAVPFGTATKVWRRIMTLQVLPRLAAFKPDLILVSAGFDAHIKDAINCGYVGLREEDYEWITTQLVKIANATCGGRVVSVLEGGYKIQGRIVSPFGRSVNAHVRALSLPTAEMWNTQREIAALADEIRREREAEAARQTASMESSASSGSTLAMLVSDAAVFAPGSGEAASAASASREHATAVAAATGSSEASAESAATSGRKRRRAAAEVDYVALDARLRQQELDTAEQREKQPRLEDPEAVGATRVDVASASDGTR
jgi:acetoin utilization deacetylase AcuC-like enzyme